MFPKVQASTKLEGIESFPESYKGYLRELSNRYPNWKFTALYTNLDWKYVIDNENVFGKNLVPKSYSDRWKNTTPGEYNVEVDAGWVDSSRQAVEYSMDPRNFLNEVRIMQFEKLSYDEKTSSLDTIERILYGTEFYKNRVDYVESNGNIVNMQETYADLILRGGINSMVSPYHLASRIKQEVGPFLSHSSISGRVAGFEGLYNFYNIGATSSSEPMGAIRNGLQYAKDGKGASETIKRKFLIPWNTKERAITGGGIFIGSGYINNGQNTIYLQKFDVNDDKSGELFWHQYMTNVLAPYSESKSIYNGYNNSQVLSQDLSFVIPVYENMLQIPVDSPAISPSDFEADNTKVYANVQNTLNIRTGPSTSYETIIKVDSSQIMTRIAKGKQSGELWDKVMLDNGIFGYAFHNYLSPVPENTTVAVESVELNSKDINLIVGDTYELQAIVLPENATNKEVTFLSSDETVARVNEDGVVQALSKGKATIIVQTIDGGKQDTCIINVMEPLPEGAIIFEGGLTLNGNQISGLDIKDTTCENVKDKIITGYIIQFFNKEGQKLQGQDLIGTGSKMVVFDNEGNVLMEYKFVLYGDVNGDGKVDSIDLLVLQRHVLEMEKLREVFLKAGDIRKSGNNPSSIDLLLIQRHILEFTIIQQ